MTSLVPNPKWRALGDDGTPLAGGKIYFFEAGTSTPKDTFTDFGGGSANSNPVILDANGEADIWFATGLYKVRVDTASDVTRWTVDNVSPGGSSGAVIQTVTSIALLKALDAGSSEIVDVLGYYTAADKGGGVFYWDSTSTAADDGGVTIIPNTSPASGRWIRIFEGDVSVLWFGALGDYIVSGAVNGSATDNVTFFNNTFTFCRTNELNSRLPKGSYLVSGALNCAVSIIGDQKGKVEDNVVYGNTTWNTGAPNNLDGCSIVWDKSTLTVSEVYLRNVSGDNTSDVQFKNITFYSLSSGGAGGGKLLVNDSSQSGTEYNLGSLPTFDNCHIVNFGTAITINVFDGWTISTVNFKGCQQPILAGNDTPEVAKNITVSECRFENVGDLTTAFVQLDNVEMFKFTRCFMESTSVLSLRIALNQGLLFEDCYITNSGLDASGDFIEVVSTAGFDVDNVLFYRCSSALNGMGNINLIQSTNVATLSIVDSYLSGSVIPLGTNNVTINEFGTVITAATTGTGDNNKFTTQAFQYKNVVIDGDAGTNVREIKLLANNQTFNIGASVSNTLTNGARLQLLGDLHSGEAADATLAAGDGTNPGDVNLTAESGKQVIVTGADDSTSASTGALNVFGGIGVQKTITTAGNIDIGTLGGGLKIAIGANATAGNGTLVASTIVISTTAVLTASLIFLSYNEASITAADAPLTIVSISNGVSFTVAGDGTADFFWFIINPS